MHMGIEGEGKVSEWAKLEPGMEVQLFNKGLSRKNYGFEKVWIFKIIGKPYGQESGYHIYWLEPHPPSCDIPFQSAFLQHSLQFQITYSPRSIISARSMNVHWDRG
jgi:hypothetical protein